MSTTKIYNVGAFGFSENVRLQVNTARLLLRWSKHALNELLTDRYGPVPAGFLDKRFDGSEWFLAEAETVNTMRGEIVTKFVVRRDIDLGRSLVLVIMPEGLDSGFVKTAWINLTTDTHKTLRNITNFSRP